MKKANLVVFTQNLKLDSLGEILTEINKDYSTVLLTSHCLFENEIESIEGMIGNVETYTFASLMSDADMEKIDIDAYKEEHEDIGEYYRRIKVKKNELIISRILEKIDPIVKLILCDDLGIDLGSWLKAGFRKVELEYYHKTEVAESENKTAYFQAIKRFAREPVYSTRYNGKKYVFYGSMNRIGYRLNSEFKRDRLENWLFIATIVSRKLFNKSICRKNVKHISTLHESLKWRFPKLSNYEVGLIQDGYLPPNYSSLYLKFINPNEHYYAWDTLGMQVFHNQNIPVKMLPLRKKLYLPEPELKRVKSVLCIASGAGDWTAMKNRSDEDMMILAFIEVAKRHPEIKFVYRCHPNWVYPAHQGMNSINRVAEYFSWLNLPNLVLSGNIPSTNLDNFQLSISRNSLAEDLKEVDIVFGEHSISMVDAAFKRIPFASVNVTGRRDFFCGMTSLGFPHCESIEDIESVLIECGKQKFDDAYKAAVEKYNRMTDEE
ncbi:MAG: hypothetical protein HFI29_12060 [Lachnospiraceae bacterium]|jgi:hypothetical protein|nr:hypothetical protein [Lachnospiraceae bacterium]